MVTSAASIVLLLKVVAKALYWKISFSVNELWKTQMSALNDSSKILISHYVSLLTLCIKLINFHPGYRNSFLQIVASDLLKTCDFFFFFCVKCIIQITIFSVSIIPFAWFVAGHDFSDFITVPLAAGAYLTQEETVQATTTKLTTHFGAVQIGVYCCACPAL